jgi:predicted nucleic acid-binding protein
VRFVLDASVALAWFLPEENEAHRAYAQRVLAVAREELALATVPLLWHEELADVLLRSRRAREISAAKLDEALALEHGRKARARGRRVLRGELLQIAGELRGSDLLDHAVVPDVGTEARA